MPSRSGAPHVSAIVGLSLESNGGRDEFRLAAGVAFVDDFVANAEAAAIDTLAGALGLEKAASQAILRDVHEALFGGN